LVPADDGGGGGGVPDGLLLQLIRYSARKAIKNIATKAPTGLTRRSGATDSDINFDSLRTH
jgi:hypothetical protein